MKNVMYVGFAINMEPDVLSSMYMCYSREPACWLRSGWWS